jgi:cytochrome bd ubiquinol oxidase subunit I
VSEIMPDVSPWAFTPSLGFAAKMVTLNMVVFWLTALFLFWLSSRGEQCVPLMERASVDRTLLRPPSEEA